MKRLISLCKLWATCPPLVSTPQHRQRQRQRLTVQLDTSCLGERRKHPVDEHEWYEQ